MISNVHMRLIFQVSDDSSGYPKYRTIDIPMNDLMLGTMTEQIACADLGREPAVPIDPDSYLAKELERANVEIERLRKGYAECMIETDLNIKRMRDLDTALQNALADLTILREGYSDCINDLIRLGDVIAPDYGSTAQRHRDILTGSD